MSVLTALLVDASGCGLRTLPADADPDLRIRARLDACREGMAQLDALREKHHKLMQTMRIRLPNLPLAEDDSPLRGETQHRKEMVQDALPTCQPLRVSTTPSHSPNSVHDLPVVRSQSSQLRSDSPAYQTCISHRSSVSIDSGCGVSVTSQDATIIASGDIAPMAYATYRKKSIEERKRGQSVDERILGLSEAFEAKTKAEWRPPRPPRSESLLRESSHRRNAEHQQEDHVDTFQIVASTIESTTAMRAPSMRRLGRIERPRSMFEKGAEEEQRRAVLEENAYRNSTLERSFTRSSSLIDSMSFSQITPPPVQRKFGVAEVSRPPVEASLLRSSRSPPPSLVGLRPITLTVNKTPPTATMTAAAKQVTIANGHGTVYKSPTTPPSPSNRQTLYMTQSTCISASKQPYKAEITPPRDVMRAEKRNSVVTSRAATILSSDASRTPPTRRVNSRPLSLHEVKVALTPDEEIDGIFHARPARVLSRQSSSSSSASSGHSPPGGRKQGVVLPPSARLIAAAHSQIKRTESGGSSNTSSRTRLEKMWRESEGL